MKREKAPLNIYFYITNFFLYTHIHKYLLIKVIFSKAMFKIRYTNLSLC